MKTKSILTYFSIIISLGFSYHRGRSQESSPVHVADVSLSADSLLKTYSIDELLELQEYYKGETERLLQEKEELRQKGIRDMETFVKNHPNSPILDKILIRLAELHYEQALSDFGVANDEYNRLLKLHDQGQIKELPQEPVKEYGRALSLYQQIIDEFPQSQLMDDALYNKGFLLEELGNREQAFEVYQNLIDSYPDSKYIPDALMRMAEYYFNPPVNEIEKAIELYQQVLNYKESPIYDAALYRLGWAYYRLSDYPSAISYFTILADDIERSRPRDPQARYHFPAVRDEAVEYIGISFLDYGGSELAAQYFNEIGGRSYGLEVLRKIGDVYMDVKEEYDKAISAYQLLLSMYPNAPEAPKIQAKIAEAYRNLEDERMAYVRRAELFRKYRSGSEWWKNTKDPHAKEEASSLAEVALRDNIFLLLRRGEETGDQNLYFQAINDSRDFLSAFPSSENAPHIHWNMALTLDTKLGMHDEAFDEYIKISNLYWNSKFQKQAAENAIAIADEAVRRDTLTTKKEVMPLTIGEIRARLSSKDSLQKVLNLQRKELTPEEKKLAYALDNYVKLFPHDPETANILAKGGALYYDRKQFRESLKYFKTLVKHFPDSPEVNYARFLIMESYFGKADYKSAEIVAKNLRDISPEYREKANRRLAESIFLQAKTFSDSLEYLKAAEEYKRVVESVPKVEFADLALYNASLEYERAKEYRRAVESYTELLDKYPQSEYYLNTLNNLAFDYRELDDFINAALTYEKLANVHPEEEKAQTALYNASISYVEAEEWERAIRVNNKFVERFPDAEDASNLLFNNAGYYLKLGDIESANRIYINFTEKYPNSPRVVEAYFLRGEYLRENNLFAEAGVEFEKAVKKNDEFKERGLESNDYYAAEALYWLTELKYQEFKKIEFKLPPSTMSQNKAKKKALLLDIVNNYTKVAAYGTFRLYEATYKIGLAYEEFAETWARQEIPPMDENRRIVTQKEINQTSGELYERAVEAYKNGVIVLTRLAEAYRQSLKPDSVASVTDKWVPEDTTLVAGSRWIDKCRMKISENLYDIAEINFQSVNQLLSAPPPAGVKKLEELVYRHQLIVKAVKPLLEEIVTAHTRNIREGEELGLDNQWIELSKSKIITTNNIAPNEFWKLGNEALLGYSGLVKTYADLVEKGDEAAFDVADQMINFLEFGKSYALAGAKGYRDTIEKARSLNIENPDVAKTEENLMKSIYDYGKLANTLSNEANEKRRYYEKLFHETERVDYEDALFAFEENHGYLVDHAQEILSYGYDTSQELGIENQWTYEIMLTLVRMNPEALAQRLGLEIVTKQIPSNSQWLVASEYHPDWTQVDFVDSVWTNATENAPGTKFAGSEAKIIWVQQAKPEKAEQREDSLASDKKPAPRLYFRGTFEIEGLPVAGIFQISMEDSFNLFINSREIAQYRHTSAQETNEQVYDVGEFLRSGKNVLAIEVFNSEDSGGGLEALLQVRHLPEWDTIQENYQNLNEGKLKTNNVEPIEK